MMTVTFDETKYAVVPLIPTQDMLDAVGPKPKRWDATPMSKRLRDDCDQMRREEYATMVGVAVQQMTEHME